MGEDTRDTLTAGAYILVAQLIFGINELLIKWTAIKISALQLIVNMVHLLCLIWWWTTRSSSVSDQSRSITTKWYGNTVRDRVYIWTHGLLFSTIFMFYYAVIRLPMGDLQCLFYQSPLWIIFCCWFFFGDRPPTWFILTPSTILTVVGVICVSQPPFLFTSGDPLPIDGVLAILLSCIRWIGSVLIVKKGKDNVHYLQYQFGCTLCSLSISVPIMFMLNSLWIDNPLIGTLHDLLHIPWQHVLAAIFIGLAQFTGMSLSVMAYQKGNGARISWLEYIAIPISFGLYHVCVRSEKPSEEKQGFSLETCFTLIFNQIYLASDVMHHFPPKTVSCYALAVHSNLTHVHLSTFETHYNSYHRISDLGIPRRTE